MIDEKGLHYLVSSSATEIAQRQWYLSFHFCHTPFLLLSFSLSPFALTFPLSGRQLKCSCAPSSDPRPHTIAGDFRPRALEHPRPPRLFVCGDDDDDDFEVCQSRFGRSISKHAADSSHYLARLAEFSRTRKTLCRRQLLEGGHTEGLPERWS